MKTLSKIAVTVSAAAFVAVALMNARSQDAFAPQTDWPNNDFTNKVVVPTVECYTNTQSAVSLDQQYRVSQEGVVGKGATALQHGPRIEPRPPTGYLQAEPGVQQDRPWDIDPNNPDLNPAVTDQNAPGH